MKKLTAIVTLIALIILIVIIILSINSNNIIKKTQTTSSDTIPSELLSYFKNQMQSKVINEIGQPIEGFEPSMFMQVYPNLQKQDFNNVEALQGVYKIQNNELQFQQSKEQPIHSAAQAISEKGIQALLENLSKRLNIQVKDTNSIDEIIETIS